MLRVSPCCRCSGDVKGSLELAINATGERNTYALIGRAAEPTAEGQIVIECQARKPAVKQFNVPNIVGTGTEYKVGGMFTHG